MTFAELLDITKTRFAKHPHWKMLDGTPWTNDAPVLAAEIALNVQDELRQENDRMRKALEDIVCHEYNYNVYPTYNYGHVKSVAREALKKKII